MARWDLRGTSAAFVATVAHTSSFLRYTWSATSREGGRERGSQRGREGGREGGRECVRVSERERESEFIRKQCPHRWSATSREEGREGVRRPAVLDFSVTSLSSSSPRHGLSVPAFPPPSPALHPTTWPPLAFHRIILGTSASAPAAFSLPPHPPPKSDHHFLHQRQRLCVVSLFSKYEIL